MFDSSYIYDFPVEHIVVIKNKYMMLKILFIILGMKIFMNTISIVILQTVLLKCIGKKLRLSVLYYMSYIYVFI